MIACCLFTTCDVIENPIKEGTVVWNKRKILIYDFTGHRCNNCPEGHKILEELEKIYGDSVIVPVAIHCTSFAKIIVYPENFTGPKKYTYDFRTEIGDYLGGKDENPGFWGNLTLPIGLINSLSGDKLKNITAWATEAQKYILSIPEFFINITTNFSEDSTISCDIKIKTNLENSKNLNLVVFLTEDSIIQGQRTNDSSLQDGYNPEYHHSNILRAGFNIEKVWGDNINKDKKLVYQSEINKSYSMSAKKHDWKIENCNIVAFIYDYNTKEVYQVEKVRIKK